MITEADWTALRTGGMPAYERILRLLHAEQAELSDRLSQIEADMIAEADQADAEWVAGIRASLVR